MLANTTISIMEFTVFYTYPFLPITLEHLLFLSSVILIWILNFFFLTLSFLY
jgi:hypothetical protein